MISFNDNISINKKHKELIVKICTDPIPSDIKWKEIHNLAEALIKELGGKADTKRNGSRVCFKIGNRKMILHKPHPNPEVDKGALKQIRECLYNEGVVYETS